MKKNNNKIKNKLEKQLAQLSSILQKHKDELIIKVDEGVLGAALPSYLEYLYILNTLHSEAKARQFSLTNNDKDTSNNEIENITSSFASFSLPPPPSPSLSSFSFGSSLPFTRSFNSPSTRPSFGSSSSPSFGGPSHVFFEDSFSSPSSFFSHLPSVPEMERKKERTILPKPIYDEHSPISYDKLSPPTFILHETATGYALFELLQSLEKEEAIYYSQSFSLLQEAVKLIAFHPFSSSKDAMLAYRDIQDGIAPVSLIDFLKQNLPEKKDKHICLVTMDWKLFSNISEAIPVVGMSSSNTVIYRGIREFIAEFYAIFTTGSQETHEGNAGACEINAKDAEEREIHAQLCLGHQLGARMVKYDQWMVDQYVVTAVRLLDQVDGHVNSAGTRLRNCYSIHFPELSKLIFDHSIYAMVVKRIKDKKNISELPKDELALIVGDDLVDQIYSAARCSIGTEMLEVEFTLFEELADQISQLLKYRQQLSEYIHNAMTKIAPSLHTLMGEMGARLIARAGSLYNLSKLPSSTIQLMGAEKALFRALRTRGPTPKYGILFHSSYVQMSLQKDKGKVARFVANKVSIAARVDSFSSDKTAIFGKKLAEQVIDKLKYISTGEKPRKNVDVMRDAVLEHNEEISKKRKL